MMTTNRYPLNVAKIFVPIITVVLLLLMLSISDPVIVAFLCFSSLITTMLHFNVFEDTSDTHPLNRIDLVLQVVFLLASFFRAFILGATDYH